MSKCGRLSFCEVGYSSITLCHGIRLHVLCWIEGWTFRLWVARVTRSVGGAEGFGWCTDRAGSAVFVVERMRWMRGRDR